MAPNLFVITRGSSRKCFLYCGKTDGISLLLLKGIVRDFPTFCEPCVPRSGPWGWYRGRKWGRTHRKSPWQQWRTRYPVRTFRPQTGNQIGRANENGVLELDKVNSSLIDPCPWNRSYLVESNRVVADKYYRREWGNRFVLISYVYFHLEQLDVFWWD